MDKDINLPESLINTYKKRIEDMTSEMVQDYFHWDDMFMEDDEGNQEMTEEQWEALQNKFNIKVVFTETDKSEST